MTKPTFDASSAVMTVPFGYYPVACDLSAPKFSIQTLPGHAETVSVIKDDPDVSNNWIYPGAQQQVDFMSGNVRSMPYSARIFGMPKTHTLAADPSWSPANIEFVVWCLSFFVGMRLSTTERGFLDATPIEPGTLVDFILVRCTLADAVRLAMDYLDAERDDPRAPKRVAAVIHALFLAQRPQALPFERFQYLYMALDACFSLVSAKGKGQRIPHRARIEWMCLKFGMPVPSWAASAAVGNVRLAAARNDTFHEALFFGEPLGFSLFGGNERTADHDRIPLQMKALVCRLLVAILGQLGADYVRTHVDTRQRYALTLHP